MHLHNTPEIMNIMKMQAKTAYLILLLLVFSSTVPAIYILAQANEKKAEAIDYLLGPPGRPRKQPNTSPSPKVTPEKAVPAKEPVPDSAPSKQHFDPSKVA